MNVDPSTLLVLCLGALLVVAVIRRSHGEKTKGLLGGETAQKREAPPVQHNGTASEIKEAIGSVMRYAARKDWKLVCPGCVLFEEKLCRATVLLVGPGGVLGLRFYGYGGKVAPAPSGPAWEQELNGSCRTIDNPLLVMQQDTKLLSRALAAGGFANVPVQSLSVLTHPQVSLTAPKGTNILLRSELKGWLENHQETASSRVADPAAVAAYLEQLAVQGQKAVQDAQESGKS